MSERTAIIVNDRGEAFVGWFSACDISPSGYESYRSVAVFARRTLLKRGTHPLFDGYPPTDRWVDEPRVYSSARVAARAMKRVSRYHFGQLAIVT
jgi:hypothetical protein